MPLHAFLPLLMLLLTALLSPAPAGAEQSAQAADVPRLSQSVVQRFEVPGTRYETIILRVEFPPNYEVSRHSHPGPQGSYVLAGSMTYVFDGEAPSTRTAGETQYLPADSIHGGKAGPSGAILLNTYLIEKGKPLSVAAPTQGSPTPP